MIKRLIIGLSVLVLVLLGAVLALPGLVPTDTYRAKLETDLSRVFARDVKITGDIDITTFPVLKVQTGAVSLANPENFPEGQFVDVQAMSAKVKLWPLLQKRVEISAVTLESPQINLVKQADGRANWQTEGEPKEPPKDTGPFKRDGRFTEYDPSLSLLRIENGSLDYSDAAKGQAYKLANINIDLKAPGLDQQLRVEGSLNFDGLDTSIDAQIDSPADFLNGLKTGFEASLSTDEAEVDVTGQFSDSQDIALKAEFKVSSQTPNAFAARLSLPEDIALPALSSINAAGQVSFDAKATRFPALDLALKGDGVDASFIGNVDLADGAENAGEFSASLNDMALITPYLDEPIKALDAVTSAAAKGKVKWSGSAFTLNDLIADIKGNDLKATFNGTASYDSTLTLSGSFDGATQDFASLVETAGMSQPDAAALKRLNATGQISLTNGEAKLSNIIAEASEGFLNGKYSGGVTYADALGLDGEFSGDIPDLGALDAALPREIPYSDVAKEITISSKIQSQSGGFTFSNLTAQLSQGRLNGDFNGKLTLGDASDLSGNLSLSAESLRNLATTQGVTLPASTTVGRIFEAFALSGNVSGTPEEITFNSGTIAVDSLSGRGDFTLKMTGSKPLLTGALSLGELDLRPYMAAWSEQNPSGAIMPWSEDPIALSGLDSVDAAITISTPAIRLDRLEIGTTDGVVNLKNGTLSADLKNTQLYGGNASGVFSVKSENGIPRVDINAKINSVTAENFFMASGGFDKVTGSSDISMSFTGRGQSQAAIMKTLSGDGIFKVINGQLKGIDAGTLLSGVDTALAQRQIPEGIGLGQTTDFNDIDSRFTLTNGRATLNGFQVKSGTFFMEADGFIDIGQQVIDIGIRPKLTSGSDLAKFGIPLRFRGGFGQAKASLDGEALTDIAAAKARQSAGDAVRDRVGGTLGGILGGVIGGDTSNPSPSPSPSSESEVTPASPQSDTSSEADQQNDGSEPETDQTEIETPEEQIGNALKDLFGRKKKN